MSQISTNLQVIFADPEFGMWNLLSGAIVLSGFFALLIGALPTKAGPVRLFLAGLLLPALSIKLAQLP